ncbi:MAG TPA: MBL fold metallo-hydrolase [Oscillatoriaceae cyanobacterium]
MPFQLQVFRSGSSGNCALLTSGRTRLLIDAGVGPRVLAKELSVHGLGVRDLTAAIFTHCHHDHLRANTLALLAREGVTSYMAPGTWERARKRDAAGLLDAMPANRVGFFDPESPFELEAMAVETFRVSHGDPGPHNPAGDPVGFTMHDGADTFGYCTDVGFLCDRALACLGRADLLVLESNHDIEMERMSARPWPTKQWILGETGHLSNVQAAAAIAELFANREGKGVLLAHLSEMCNTSGLARETAREAIAGRGELRIGVAQRHTASTPWELKHGVATALAETFAGL